MDWSEEGDWEAIVERGEAQRARKGGEVVVDLWEGLWGQKGKEEA